MATEDFIQNEMYPQKITVCLVEDAFRNLPLELVAPTHVLNFFLHVQTNIRDVMFIAIFLNDVDRSGNRKPYEGKG